MAEVVHTSGRAVIRATRYHRRSSGKAPRREGCYAGGRMRTSDGSGGEPEVIFLVEEAPEGGLTARALGESIFTEAEGTADLHEKIRDAVRCHFIEGQAPRVIRLHFVREEVITA